MCSLFTKRVYLLISLQRFSWMTVMETLVSIGLKHMSQSSVSRLSSKCSKVKAFAPCGLPCTKSVQCWDLPTQVVLQNSRSIIHQTSTHHWELWWYSFSSDVLRTLVRRCTLLQSSSTYQLCCMCSLSEQSQSQPDRHGECGTQSKMPDIKLKPHAWVPLLTNLQGHL